MWSLIMAIMALQISMCGTMLPLSSRGVGMTMWLAQLRPSQVRHVVVDHGDHGVAGFHVWYRAPSEFEGCWDLCSQYDVAGFHVWYRAPSELEGCGDLCSPSGRSQL